PLRSLPALLVAALGCAPARADEGAFLRKALAREVIGPRQSLLDLQDRLGRRIPAMPAVKSVAEWERHAGRIRAEGPRRGVFRGRAAAWRDAKVKVAWAAAIPGGPGYRIRKLRYEALPGLWIPALLYEPDKPAGKLPVALAVNGHDRKGKAAPYKQL